MQQIQKYCNKLLDVKDNILHSYEFVACRFAK